MAYATNAIGIFDSGIGGLSVTNAIVDLLPHEEIIYRGDTIHIPYGTKSQEQIRTYCSQITDFLLKESCKIIVVACNTASTAALSFLREQYPQISFVGTEPAVKPAAQITQSAKIGVLATAGTFKSERYASLTERFAQGVEVFENPCLGLVELIEKGKTEAPETIALLEKVTQPMLAKGIDTLVLGCTHYPFIQTSLRNIVGDDINIIDPAPAIARQVKRVLKKERLLAPFYSIASRKFFVTKDFLTFEKVGAKLLNRHIQVSKVCLNVDSYKGIN